MKIKVAVVILNWNGRVFLEKFLPNVVKYSSGHDRKIVIVDNNSTDDSIRFIRSNYPGVEIIIYNKNHGYARGYALALPQVEASYYVLLNSDVEVTEGWLEPLIALMDSDKTIGAVMPKILSFSDKNLFEYAGAGGGFIDKYGYPFCRGRILTSLEKDTGQYNDTREVFWASGACMFLRAGAYSKTGGLDGDFFAHMEEIDLCWRLKRLDYKIYYCAQSVVYHVGGGTLPNDNPRKLYYNYRNSLYLLFKNLNRGEFITILVPRIILDGISATLYILQGKWFFFMAVFRAHVRFYVSLPRLINKRRIFNKIIQKKAVDQIFKKSIVFQFFVKKIRKFSDISDPRLFNRS
jgi:hypothetical protein